MSVCVRVTQIRASSLNTKSAWKRNEKWNSSFIDWMGARARVCYFFDCVWLYNPQAHVYHVNLSISFVKHVAHIRVSFPMLSCCCLHSEFLLIVLSMKRCSIIERNNWDGILNVGIMIFRRICHQIIDFIDQEHRVAETLWHCCRW